MQFVAIFEKRRKNWYVYIPALATGGPVPEQSDDVHACAVALVAAATGQPPVDVKISLHRIEELATVVPLPPTDVEVWHHDGAWWPAEHTGWLRQWGGSWNPLVDYTAEGATWRRAVQTPSLRQPSSGVASSPEPRRDIRAPRPRALDLSPNTVA